jgi:hypothetical protein
MGAYAGYGGLCQEDCLMPCKGGPRKRGVPCSGLCGPSLLSDVHHCNVVTPMHAHVRAHCANVRSYAPANWAQQTLLRLSPVPEATGFLLSILGVDLPVSLRSGGTGKAAANR